VGCPPSSLLAPPALRGAGSPRIAPQPALRGERADLRLTPRDRLEPPRLAAKPASPRPPSEGHERRRARVWSAHAEDTRTVGSPRLAAASAHARPAEAPRPWVRVRRRTLVPRRHKAVWARSGSPRASRCGVDARAAGARRAGARRAGGAGLRGVDLRERRRASWTLVPRGRGERARLRESSFSRGRDERKDRRDFSTC
jgi:hypothetical protein